MDVLKKFTVKDLKLNKKRTIVTIIGIMLSVALITTVATMYQSLVDSLISYEINSDGNYHVYFSDISTEDAEKIVNNRNVEKVSYIDNIG
ncbi:MAG: ABC transporter permease, partial [Lachnospiraceae bacterium]|nr:ABC transporter permease [Lachnospiraceae bacterium]